MSNPINNIRFFIGRWRQYFLRFYHTAISAARARLNSYLFDIKHMDSERHFQLTGVRNELILNNLKELFKRRYNVRIRMPLLKGINDSKEEIESVAKFLSPYRIYKNFKGIDLLPYHKFGVNKYNQLDMEYKLQGDPSMAEEDMERIVAWLSEYDLPVCIVKH